MGFEARLRGATDRHPTRLRAGRKFGRHWTRLDGLDEEQLAAVRADRWLEVREVEAEEEKPSAKKPAPKKTPRRRSSKA